MIAVGRGVPEVVRWVWLQVVDAIGREWSNECHARVLREGLKVDRKA